MNSISKKDLLKLIEPHFSGELDKDNYDINTINSVDLLSNNRFDLAFKLLYLNLKEKNYDYANLVYKSHIHAFSLGKFIEPGNPSKNSYEKYISEFEFIYNSLKTNSFDKSISLIPLSSDSSIVNGSHRVASSIYLKQKVSCVNINANTHNYDFKFFKNRGVSVKILDEVANVFIEHSNDIYIALIWPSATGSEIKIDNILQNIVYKKNIILNYNGAHNLLTQIYFKEKWLGTVQSNYKGCHAKVVECFKTKNAIRAYVFKSKSIDDVLKIKEAIRDHFKIGKHSVHITDTHEEAIRISKLLFNSNSLHFLQFAKPNNFLSFHDSLDRYKKFLNSNNINPEDIIIDSSTVLSAYGIRKANDIDFLCADKIPINIKYNDINSHDEELRFYNYKKNELIYNPSFYFYFDDLKFLSLKELYSMKKNRNESKDKYDCKLMNSYLDSDYLTFFLNKFKQKLLYLIIYYKISLIKILKFLNLFKPVYFIFNLLRFK